MKGILLSRVHFNNKTGSITYSNYYVESDGEFVYLLEPDSYESDSGLKKAIFAPHKSKENRYYVAECFEQTLQSNSELSNEQPRGRASRNSID